jgi:hypothetical protein
MAVLVNNSSTNWNNAAGWSVISATGWTAALATQETNNTATATTFTSGVAFTPGAITVDAVDRLLSLVQLLMLILWTYRILQ